MTARPAKRALTEAQLHQRLEESFIPEPNSGCWLWERATFSASGYGKLSIKNVKRLAHRVSWSVHRGPIPAGLNVLHKCDNRLCINPDHLFIGTHADNVADKIAKGRLPRGTQLYNAKLNEESARIIRVSAERPTVLARRYGVSASQIHSIRKGVTWRHA